MLLSGVYSATELYMLTDYSPGLADTWQALDRRVQDVMRLGKLSQQVCSPSVDSSCCSERAARADSTSDQAGMLAVFCARLADTWHMAGSRQA